jgi:hypothetical protein
LNVIENEELGVTPAAAVGVMEKAPPWDSGGALASGEACCGGGEFAGVHDTGPAPDATLGTRRGEPGHRALVDHVAFQLGAQQRHDIFDAARPARAHDSPSHSAWWTCPSPS